MCVPERGWNTPVRVCNFCYKRSGMFSLFLKFTLTYLIVEQIVNTSKKLFCFEGSISSNCSDCSSRGDESEVGARKFSEAVVQTISSVASVLEYPKSM